MFTKFRILLKFNILTLYSNLLNHEKILYEKIKGGYNTSHKQIDKLIIVIVTVFLILPILLSREFRENLGTLLIYFAAISLIFLFIRYYFPFVKKTQFTREAWIEFLSLKFKNKKPADIRKNLIPEVKTYLKNKNPNHQHYLNNLKVDLGEDEVYDIKEIILQQEMRYIYPYSPPKSTKFYSRLLWLVVLFSLLSITILSDEELLKSSSKVGFNDIFFNVLSYIVLILAIFGFVQILRDKAKFDYVSAFAQHLNETLVSDREERIIQLIRMIDTHFPYVDHEKGENTISD